MPSNDPNSLDIWDTSSPGLCLWRYPPRWMEKSAVERHHWRTTETTGPGYWLWAFTCRYLNRSIAWTTTCWKALASQTSRRSCLLGSKWIAPYSGWGLPEQQWTSASNWGPRAQRVVFACFWPSSTDSRFSLCVCLAWTTGKCSRLWSFCLHPDFWSRQGYIRDF